MLKHTPLHSAHIAMGGKMVDFAGWQMPIHYGSQLQEHLQVRASAGMFDVSHMTVIDLHGHQVRTFLSYLLANDVNRLEQSGKALYSCMLNPEGGVIDDLIVYFIADDFFRLVVNASTRDKDMAWIKRHADQYSVTVNERSELAMLAVQGPEAIEKCLTVLPAESRSQLTVLAKFAAVEIDGKFIARTGYTGEDGFEIITSADEAKRLWHELSEAGVYPTGLGARDTLRLEAGMNLYGSDMDENITPLESGLSWTVAWLPEERDFIGRTMLEQQRKAGPSHKLVGLLLEGGVLRAHQKVFAEDGEGEVTSGSFSPTLKKSIALARVPQSTHSSCEVEIRGKHLPARIVKYPFVRNGKVLVY